MCRYMQSLCDDGGWGVSSATVSPPLPRLLLPLRVDRFVLLMTPSRYDLIQFALSNWWHTDTLWSRRRGSHAWGADPIVNIPPRQIRYCYRSLTAMKGTLCVCVCVRARNKIMRMVEVMNDDDSEVIPQINSSMMGSGHDEAG